MSDVPPSEEDFNTFINTKWDEISDLVTPMVPRVRFDPHEVMREIARNMPKPLFFGLPNTLLAFLVATVARKGDIDISGTSFWSGTFADCLTEPHRHILNSILCSINESIEFLTLDEVVRNIGKNLAEFNITERNINLLARLFGLGENPDEITLAHLDETDSGIHTFYPDSPVASFPIRDEHGRAIGSEDITRLEQAQSFLRAVENDCFAIIGFVGKGVTEIVQLGTPQFYDLLTDDYGYHIVATLRFLNEAFLLETAEREGRNRLPRKVFIIPRDLPCRFDDQEIFDFTSQVMLNRTYLFTSGAVVSELRHWRYITFNLALDYRATPGEGPFDREARITISEEFLCRLIEDLNSLSLSLRF